VMRAVIGLGNPGEKYEGTRHNIGFDVIGRLAERHGVRMTKKGFGGFWAKGAVSGVEVLWLLPQTFMNLSGGSVREALDYFKISPGQLAVAHDDLDLALGRVKWDFGSGAAGHRGVSSIIDHLGTKAFYRVRVGIGRPERKEEVESFVLSPFSKSEGTAVEAMTEEAVGLLEKWLCEEDS
jgi:PTH1 family peptidyl-tRNA hydrolase